MQVKRFSAMLLCGTLIVSVLTMTACGDRTASEDTAQISDVSDSVNAHSLTEEEYAMYSIAGAESAYPDIPYVWEITAEDVHDTVSYDEYRYYQLLYKNYFDDGDDQYWTTNPDMTERVTGLYETEIKRNHAVIAECRKYGIALTDEEITDLDYENAEMVSAFGGMDYFLEALDKYYMSTYFYNYYSQVSAMYDKLNAYYLENGQILTEESDVRALLNTDAYIRCKHILIMNDIGDDREENRALAEDILARLQNGEDFDTLMNEYSEDTGLAYNPDGYYFFRGEMEETFEAASFALEEGEMSGIVESSYGYHIILRCKKENTYLDENFADIKSTYQSLRFYELLDVVYTDWDISTCDGYETYADWHYAEDLGNLYTANT